VNVTDDGIVFVGEVLQSTIFSPVLEREEESVFETQFSGWLATELVEFFKGGLENVQHFGKGFSFYAEELFELSVAESQGFLYSCR
jgi:hypothetical protein